MAIRGQIVQLMGLIIQFVTNPALETDSQFLKTGRILLPG
jgi:hypothetical protein